VNELAQSLAGELPSNTGDAMPAWFHALRNLGAEQFRQNGLPGKRVEQWKYTSVYALEQQQPSLGVSGAVAEAVDSPQPLADLAVQVSMVDGALASVSGKAAGLSISTLQEALQREDPELRALLEGLVSDQKDQGFSALNTATLANGLLIRVAAGVRAGELLLQWNHSDQDGVLFNSRVIVMLEEGAGLHMVEQFENDEGRSSTLNLVIQGMLASRAELTLTRVQQQSTSSFLVTRTDVQQSAGSHFQFTGLDLGDGLARHDVKAVLGEEGAGCALNGACMTRGQSHADHHLEAAHMARDCRSSQLFRAVANDRLLLSKLAEIDAKPELEI
jgi:Fe-S cluster assembly protein SufD